MSRAGHSVGGVYPLLVGVLCLVCSTRGATVDDYIVYATTSCGASEDQPTTVSVRTDMYVTATALCNYNPTPRRVEFTDSEQGVLHTASVKTSGDNATDCLFYKTKDSKIYTINVDVSIGEPGSFVHTQHQSYLITCSYDEKGVNIQETARVIEDAALQSDELQDNMGQASNATFTLIAMDIVDVPITNYGAAIGQKIYLRGELSGGTGSEPGVRVVSCLVHNGDAGTGSYSVLRGGCGDGYVFHKNQGFVTSGRTVKSPYFGAFKMSTGTGVQFQCNFTVCATNCDGSSCENEARRKRRAIEGTSFEFAEQQTSASRIWRVRNKTCSEPITEKLANGIVMVARQRPHSSRKSTDQIAFETAIVPIAVIVIVGLLSLVVILMCKRRITFHVPNEVSKFLPGRSKKLIINEVHN